MNNRHWTHRWAPFVCTLLLAACQTASRVEAAGAQSLRLQPGLQGSYTAPSGLPFSALGDFRVEMRLSGFTACPENYSNIWSFGVLQLRCFLAGQTSINIQDEAASRGVVIPLDNRPDVLLRIQRRISAGSITVEIWNTADGGGYQLLSVSGVSTNLANVSGTRAVGGPTTSVDVAWLRWSSQVLENGSAPPQALAQDGDLASWNLNGNRNDASSHHMNISLSGATYVTTPDYPPVALVQPEQPEVASMPTVAIARAGMPLKLSATRSFSVNETSANLTYGWQQTSGPSHLSWQDRETATPSVSGLVFGQYSVRLTVTDALGQTAHSDFTFGVVAADRRNIVQPDDELVNRVLGPLPRWGSSPWPYMDDRHKALADFFGERLSVDPNLQDDWNHELPGKVSVTVNSAEVTGTGTDFQAQFCNGTTTPAPGIQLVLWYPVAPDTSKTGRRGYDLLRCDSATTITLRRPYITTDSVPEMSYARFSCPGCWFNGSNNVNYYDNVLAFYSLYYRTGLTKYRDFARLLVDRWWTMPTIDEGRACWFSDFGPRCPPPRVWSLTGLLWRAHEGRPEMWGDLRRFLRVARDSNQNQLVDTREQGYQLAFLSVAAMLDPDPVEQNRFRSEVNTALTQIWERNQNAVGVWDNFSFGFESANTNPTNTVTTVTGSNIIHGNGTTNYWPADPRGNWILVQGDPQAYYTMPGSDNTHLVLDRPYAGPGGTNRTYQMNVLVGRGTQPFTLGIAATGFGYAHSATGNPLARKFLLDTASWLRHYGIRPTTRGLYYGRGYLPCEPNPDLAPNCVNGPATDISTIANDRYLNGEVVGALARAFTASGGDAEIRDVTDNLYGAALGKAGGPSSDSNYVLELDETTIFNKAKNFGFFFGFGAATIWPAIRLATADLPAGQAVRIGYPTAPVPATATAQLKLQQLRNGRIEPFLCASPPCSLTLDSSGAYNFFQIEYQGSGNWASSLQQPVRVK